MGDTTLFHEAILKKHEKTIFQDGEEQNFECKAESKILNDKQKRMI